MENSTKDASDSSAHHPEEQAAGTNDSPKFGRLLIVLVFAVMLVGILTVTSEMYFSK